MAAKSDKNLKLYYSIKEVAEMFEVKESLLTSSLRHPKIIIE